MWLEERSLTSAHAELCRLGVSAVDDLLLLTTNDIDALAIVLITRRKLGVAIAAMGQTHAPGSAGAVSSQRGVAGDTAVAPSPHLGMQITASGSSPSVGAGDSPAARGERPPGVSAALVAPTGGLPVESSHLLSPPQSPARALPPVPTPERAMGPKAGIELLARSLRMRAGGKVDAQAEAMRAIAVALRGGRGVTMRRDRFATLLAPYIATALPAFPQERGGSAIFSVFFDAMNTDGSGVLSIAELMCGFAAIFDFDRRELSRQLFGVCDATANGGRGDGRLTCRECVAAFAAFGAVSAIVHGPGRAGESPAEEARATAAAMFDEVLGDEYGERDCITKAQWSAWWMVRRIDAYSPLRAGRGGGGTRRASFHAGEMALSPSELPEEHVRGGGGARRASFHAGEMALSPSELPREQRAVAVVATPTDDAVAANRKRMMGWGRSSPLWPPAPAPAERHNPPQSPQRRELRPPLDVSVKHNFAVSARVSPVPARPKHETSPFALSPPPGVRVGHGPPGGPVAQQPSKIIGARRADLPGDLPGSAAGNDVALPIRRERQMATWHAAFVEAVAALRNAGSDPDDFFRSAEQQRTTAKGLSRRLLARGVRLRPTVLHNLYLYTIAAVKGGHRTL